MSAGAERAQGHWQYWTAPSKVTVDGLETAYRRDGSGEALVYLHGAGMTRRWLPLFEKLAERFDTVVPEHPGFGDTPMPEWLHDFQDLVLHYDGVLSELGIERPHLVGHSLGGWIAASLAFTYRERFASLTLISPMGLMVPEAPLPDAFRQAPEEMLDLLFSGAGERYMELLDEGDDLEATIHRYSEAITFARLTWNPRYDWRLARRLGRISTPTLIVQPADDRFVPRIHAERWAELIPNAKLEIIEGSGGEPASHQLILQQPDRLASLIAKHARAS